MNSKEAIISLSLIKRHENEPIPIRQYFFSIDCGKVFPSLTCKRKPVVSNDAENRLPWRFVMRDGPLGIDVELERADLREPSLVPTGAP